MDDSRYGTADSRGSWTPNDPIRYPEVFVWPPRLSGVLRWLPRYLFPWGVIYALLASVVWFWLTPPVETMQSLSAGWILLILARNAGLTLLIVGGQHLWLYIRRAQGTAFKYNRKWPDGRHPGFTFGTQVRDNLFWTFFSGLPIWTAWEVTSLWLYANGHVGTLHFAAHPVWFALLWFCVPLLHEFHFYCVHRLLHWPPLYRRFHRVHHRNINPGPWSGLSMHPVEHLLYFSGFVIYWIVPAHPLHMMHYSMMTGLSPAQGHTGFDRVVTGEARSIHLPYYAHYLHHRYFEVNYADGTIPLDKWFGSFHDGSPEGDELLKRRRGRGRV